jgi:hypothetical protein
MIVTSHDEICPISDACTTPLSVACQCRFPTYRRKGDHRSHYSAIAEVTLKRLLWQSQLHATRKSSLRLVGILGARSSSNLGMSPPLL